MYWLTWAIAGVLVWWIMGTYQKANDGKGGWWAALIASLLGSWLGDWTLGDWGWMFYDYNVIAGLIGAFVITWLWKVLKIEL